jgi:hypothetical protein
MEGGAALSPPNLWDTAFASGLRRGKRRMSLQIQWQAFQE